MAASAVSGPPCPLSFPGHRVSASSHIPLIDWERPVLEGVSGCLEESIEHDHPGKRRGSSTGRSDRFTHRLIAAGPTFSWLRAYRGMKGGIGARNPRIISKKSIGSCTNERLRRSLCASGLSLITELRHRASKTRFIVRAPAVVGRQGVYELTVVQSCAVLKVQPSPVQRQLAGPSMANLLFPK